MSHNVDVFVCVCLCFVQDFIPKCGRFRWWRQNPKKLVESFDCIIGSIDLSNLVPKYLLNCYQKMKYRQFVMTCTQSFSALRSQFRLLISSSKQETKRRFYFTANRKPKQRFYFTANRKLKRRFYFTANRKPKRRFCFTANRKPKRRFYFTAKGKPKRRFYFTAKESITLLMSISQCLQQ